jgi:hypothetical protein
MTAARIISRIANACARFLAGGADEMIDYELLSRCCLAPFRGAS